MPLARLVFKKLFSFDTSHNHFLFIGYFYDQVDWVAMGSPLALILANLFMGFHEEQWLSNYKDSPILFYRRYVNDTFVYSIMNKMLWLCLDYLNT